MKALGTVFRKIAFASLASANLSFMGRLVAPGLKLLSGEILQRELRAALLDVASAAGLRLSDVEGVLPIAQIDAHINAVHAAQRAAVLAWRNQPEQDRRDADVALVSEQGTIPHVYESLHRLSQNAGEASDLGRALHELALAIYGWQELLTTIGVVLDDPKVLAAAVRRRLLRRAAVGLAVALAVLLGAMMWRTRAAARERIAATLAQNEPCSALSLAPDDVARATPEQRTLVTERQAECERKRAAAELEAQAKERRRAQEAQCRSLATQLEKPVQSLELPASAYLTDEQRALMQRVALGPLEATDYALEKPDFPCDGLGHGPVFDAAFSRALVRDRGWVEAVDLSKRARTLLVVESSKLSVELVNAFAVTVEQEAAKAIRDGSASAITRAQQRCTLGTALGRTAKKFCGAVAKL